MCDTCDTVRKAAKYKTWGVAIFGVVFGAISFYIATVRANTQTERHVDDIAMLKTYKEVSDTKFNDVNKKLDRIENKLDQMLLTFHKGGK